jgi:hypothetical protein
MRQHSGYRRFAAALALSLVLCSASPAARAAGCEEIIAQHMVGEALLAAQLVAAAEEAGVQPNDMVSAERLAACK